MIMVKMPQGTVVSLDLRFFLENRDQTDHLYGILARETKPIDVKWDPETQWIFGLPCPCEPIRHTNNILESLVI